MWVQASGDDRSSWPEATGPRHADRIGRGVSIGRPWSDGGCTYGHASVERETRQSSVTICGEHWLLIVSEKTLGKSAADRLELAIVTPFSRRGPRVGGLALRKLCETQEFCNSGSAPERLTFLVA